MRASSLLKSRFADDKGYELTELGSQFIHYVMNEQVKKLSQHGKVKKPEFDFGGA